MEFFDYGFMGNFNGDSFVCKPSKKNNLTAGEEKQLFFQLRNPKSSPEEVQTAKDRLVMGTINQIYYNAFRYQKFCRDMWEDLVQEGFLGVLESFEGYSSSKGASFATYAAFKVRRNIQRSANKKIVPYAGRVKIEQYENIKKAENQFVIERGEYKPIFEEEVAERSGLPVSKVREYRKQSGLSNTVSLNKILYEDKNGNQVELSDDLRSDYEEAIDEEICGEDKTNIIRIVREELKKFSESEQKMLRIYVENRHKNGWSKKIASELGITEENAKKSLKKLRKRLESSPVLVKVFNENCRA